MNQGISEVLPFAIGIAISPIPIIAVILILFSARAKVNGPAFLAGWVIGLTVAATVVYLLSQAGDVGTDSGASDTVSWGKIVLGVCCSAWPGGTGRSGRSRASSPTLPKWMATVETITPVRAFGLAVLLSVVNPKNLILAVGAAAGLGQLDLATERRGRGAGGVRRGRQLSVAFAVVYEFVGGAKARATLDELKGWMTEHNNAVMAVLFLVFGVVLIAKGIGRL